MLDLERILNRGCAVLHGTLLKGNRMLVKELIRRLQCFDEEHNVNIEVDAECGHLKVKCEIDDVQFKHGDCALIGFQR